jgi:hypothetical protein
VDMLENWLALESVGDRLENWLASESVEDT